MSKTETASKNKPKEASGKDKLNFAEGLTERLVEVYEATLSVLEEGIAAGKTNPMLGYMSLLVYADLLHGGAYTQSIQTQPYYNQPEFQDFINSLQLPLGATEAQKEVIFNSDVSHVFPKLITDQTAFVLKDFTDRIFTLDTATILSSLASTNLKTLVEGVRGVRGRGKATQAAALTTESEL